MQIDTHKHVATDKEEHGTEGKTNFKTAVSFNERRSLESLSGSRSLRNSLGWAGFKSLSTSSRIFISSFLCVAGFCYLTLLGSIWFDTEMNVSLITEGYGTMGNIELIQHSFRHLFWFFGIFAFSGMLFLLTSFPEKLKVFLSIIVPLLILSDIGSAWGIRHQSFFSYTMIGSGFLLALSFLAMFLLVQYDLWFRKGEKGS